MTFPVIAAALGAVIIILQQILTLSVGLHRGKAQIGVGSAGDLNLERKVRRHGNLAENAALFIVLTALLEMFAGSTTSVKVLAILFLVSRILHMIGFSSLTGSHLAVGNKAFLIMRTLGAFGTIFASLGTGIFIFLSFMAMHQFTNLPT